MKKNQTNSILVLFIACAFMVTMLLAPSTAEARYRSHYDDYPGEDSLPWGTIILVGVIGGLAVSGIAYLVTHKKTDDETGDAIEDSDQTTEEKSDSTQVIENEQEISFKELLNAPERELSNVKFYVGLDQVDETFSSKLSQPGFADVQLNVGFALSF